MTEPTDTLIRLDGVDAKHDHKLALQGVDLTIEAGTVTAVIGPNGAGKSTLFSLISRRLRPSAGTVTVNGPVADVLQATALDEQLRLTVDDVVRMGRYPTRGLLGRMQESDRAACDDALDRVGMLHLRRRPITDLSGGERQRALVNEPGLGLHLAPGSAARFADALLAGEPKAV